MYQDSIDHFAQSGEEKAEEVRNHFPAFLIGAAMAGAVRAGPWLHQTARGARHAVRQGRESG